MPDINSLLKAGGGATLDASIYDRQVQPTNMLTGYGQAAAVARQLTALGADQVDLVHKRFDGMKGLVGSLAADPTKTKQDYISAAMNAADQGFATQDQARNIIDQLRGLPDNPGALQAFGKMQLLHTLNAHDRFSEVVGSPIQVQRGGSTDVFNANRTTGTVTPMAGGSIPTTLSPGQKTEMVDDVDPTTGAKRATPKGSVFDDRGNMPRIPVYRNGRPAPQPDASGGAGSTSPVDVSGSALSGTGGSAPIVTSQNAPATPPGPPATFTTGLGPAQSADIATSAKAYTDLRDSIGPSRMQTYTLEQALGAMRNANTGLGTDARQRIQGYLSSLPGGVGKWLAGDPSKITDYDLSKKYTTAIAMNQPGAIGSDARLGASQAANANTNMDHNAAIDVLIGNLGQEKMKQSQFHAFQNSEDKDPGAFANWSASQWGGMNDPRGYALGAMQPVERAAYVSQISGQNKARFFASVRQALKSGAITTNDLTGAAPNAQ